MDTTQHTPELLAAAMNYAEALVKYNETMQYSDDRRAKNRARDVLFQAHEELNNVAKEHTL